MNDPNAAKELTKSIRQSQDDYDKAQFQDWLKGFEKVRGRDSTSLEESVMRLAWLGSLHLERLKGGKS